MYYIIFLSSTSSNTHPEIDVLSLENLQNKIPQPSQNSRELADKLAKEINGDFLSYLVFYTHQNTHAMYHLFCEKQSTHNDFEIVHRSFLSSRN